MRAPTDPGRRRQHDAGHELAQPGQLLGREIGEGHLVQVLVTGRHGENGIALGAVAVVARVRAGQRRGWAGLGLRLGSAGRSVGRRGGLRAGFGADRRGSVGVAAAFGRVEPAVEHGAEHRVEAVEVLLPGDEHDAAGPVQGGPVGRGDESKRLGPPGGPVGRARKPRPVQGGAEAGGESRRFDRWVPHAVRHRQPRRPTRSRGTLPGRDRPGSSARNPRSARPRGR